MLLEESGVTGAIRTTLTHTQACTHACTHMCLHIPHNKVKVTVESLNLASILSSDSNLAWAETEVSQYPQLSDTRGPYGNAVRSSLDSKVG